MAEYMIGPVAGSIASDANEVVSALWNPSSTIPLYVIEFRLIKANTATASEVRRSTTRGTAGATVTPDIDNALDRSRAPASGAVLDRGNYTVNPTTEGPNLQAMLGGNASVSLEWHQVLDRRVPLIVPPGTGLAIFDTGALTDFRGLSVRWME